MVAHEPQPRYDTIGAAYARFRREDPAIKTAIRTALGDARTLVNVGAGAGSYEPCDLSVIAVEPSSVMADQRPPNLSRAISAYADALPLDDNSVDAALSILSLHHWDGAQEAGVCEMRRVATGPVVILTFDAAIWGEVWLPADYFPELAAQDCQIFPAPERIAQWLGSKVEIQTIPLSRHTPDWTIGSYWAHPERVLDDQARAATSGFARAAPDVVARVVADVTRDLEDGTWDARYGALRGLETYDVGLRLIIGHP